MNKNGTGPAEFMESSEATVLYVQKLVDNYDQNVSPGPVQLVFKS